MAGKLGEKFQGYVTGVQAFGLFVELEEVYVQGLVHVSSMNDDYYRFDEMAHRLKGENTGTTYRLGDRVEIQVGRVDLDRRQIDFALVDVLERARGATGRGKPPGGRPGAPARGRARAPKPGGSTSRGPQRRRRQK
jgi:ribonuclease R